MKVYRGKVTEEERQATINYYDYEQLARQVFYMVDDFRANIIKYLESQAK